LGPTESLERRDEQERELAKDSFSFWKNTPKSDREEMEFWLEWSSFFHSAWIEKKTKRIGRNPKKAPSARTPTNGIV